MVSRAATQWPLWVSRDRVKPATSPAMSAMPPKAEVAYDLRLASDEIGREIAMLPTKAAKRRTGI